MVPELLSPKYSVSRVVRGLPIQSYLGSRVAHGLLIRNSFDWFTVRGPLIENSRSSCRLSTPDSGPSSLADGSWTPVNWQWVLNS